MKRPVCVGSIPNQSCVDCGAVLKRDDVGISKRLVSRGLTRFYCSSCLAKRLGVPETVIALKISEYRAMGCALFSSRGEE